MEKQPKCSYCEIFGEKPHCHNCKIFNKAVTNRDPHEIPYSLEEMIAYINNPESNFDGDFRVGDYKLVELTTGEQVRLVLIDTDKDDLASGTGKAKTTFAILPIDGRYEMNVESTNRGGYTASKMRMTYLPRIFSLFPKELREAIKPVLKKTADLSVGEIKSSTEVLWLFSEVEVLGKNSYSQRGEGEQYEHFMLKKNRPFPNYVWTRSPYRSDCFCVVCGDDSGYGYAYDFCGVLFGFCI